MSAETLNRLLVIDGRVVFAGSRQRPPVRPHHGALAACFTI